MSTSPVLSLPLLIAALACAMPASAQPGWGTPGLGRARAGADDWRSPRLARGQDEREGKVDAARFVAEDAGDALGHGPIAVSATTGGEARAGEPAVYEAAVIDQLVKAGYDTMKASPEGGQIAEIRIVRDVLVPEEQKRKPVSGEMAVGVSNYGSMVGMAVGVDLTKPRKALVSTRLEARVLDRATGKALWEGRAEMATREGDSRWTDQAIATRLADALFDGFPGKSGETLARR
ncbi:DUF4136 domain-containing protein [Sphingobium lignivorans]|uniref:DUF4136 domain-containing protein n=1 Tax=Sphingobium lignivorans TaxID=2735886 RepID=A0ABR6NAF9_9SPHN|nr:DUF4136 domain-containing protein [Sphingobium lignivorans]MBB5984267.1 hypothetical protein [Sphingobium lignivorans]